MPEFFPFLSFPRRPEYVQLLVCNDEIVFFSTRDGGWFPTLRVLHKYPDMMPKLRVDTGAIKFVLSGANIMCPGLTSPGATIHDEVRAHRRRCWARTSRGAVLDANGVASLDGRPLALATARG